MHDIDDIGSNAGVALCGHPHPPTHTYQGGKLLRTESKAVCVRAHACLCVCVCVCAEGAVTKRQWPGCCDHGQIQACGP